MKKKSNKINNTDSKLTILLIKTKSSKFQT